MYLDFNVIFVRVILVTNEAILRFLQILLALFRQVQETRMVTNITISSSRNLLPLLLRPAEIIVATLDSRYVMAAVFCDSVSEDWTVLLWQLNARTKSIVVEGEVIFNFNYFQHNMDGWYFVQDEVQMGYTFNES